VNETIFANQAVGDTLFFHAMRDGIFGRDLARPTQGIAYDLGKIHQMMSDAGLEDAIPPKLEPWSGPIQSPSQDVLFIRRRA
jgi:hypothetical protein